MRPCHMLRRSVAFCEAHEDIFWNLMLEGRERPPVAPFEGGPIPSRGAHVLKALLSHWKRVNSMEAYCLFIISTIKRMVLQSLFIPSWLCPKRFFIVPCSSSILKTRPFFKLIIEKATVLRPYKQLRKEKSWWKHG